MWAWVCVRSQHRDYPRSVFPLMIPLAKLLCRGVCQQYHLLAKPSTVQRSGQRQRADSPHGGCFSPLALLPQVGSCAWGSRQPALGNRCGRGKAANPYFNLPSQKCIRLLLSHISLNVLAFSPGSQGLGLGAFNCSTGKRCLAWPPLCWAAQTQGRADTNSRLYAGIRHNLFHVSGKKELSVLCPLPELCT